jgi:uncharacterized protein
MTHPVVWFEVLGKDGSRLQSFYADLFQWKINADNPKKYGMVEAAAARGIPGGVGGELPVSLPHPGIAFYVSTPDIDKTLEQAKKLGGKVLMPRTEFPGGPHIAFVADPEGHSIGLVEEN